MFFELVGIWLCAVRMSVSFTHLILIAPVPLKGVTQNLQIFTFCTKSLHSGHIPKKKTVQLFPSLWYKSTRIHTYLKINNCLLLLKIYKLRSKLPFGGTGAICLYNYFAFVFSLALFS